MVVLCGQPESLSVPRQACNDAAMFLGESRRFERVAELIPFLPRILRKTSPLSVRQACTTVVRERMAFSTLS